jgi:hypothetical protein
MVNHDRGTNSWWHTLAGTHTASAILITGICGLIVGLNPAGAFDSRQARKHVATVLSATAKAGLESAVVAATIHLDSKIILHNAYAYDLDKGSSHNEGAIEGDDITWQLAQNKYEISPNETKLSLMGKTSFDDVSLVQLQKLEYLSKPINNDLLVTGAVIGVITSEKRFGKMIIEEAGDEPKIRCVIYDKEE